MNHSRKEDCQITEKENGNQVIFQTKDNKEPAQIPEIKAEIQEEPLISPVLNEKSSGIYVDSGKEDNFLSGKENVSPDQL